MFALFCVQQHVLKKRSDRLSKIIIINKKDLLVICKWHLGPISRWDLDLSKFLAKSGT